MLAGNYRWYEQYGFGPAPEDIAFLEQELGGDAPVDVGLRGGETLRLGRTWRVEVLALPGHTPGHLGLWDPRSGAAIVLDAALADGVCDRAGRRMIPPRYYSAGGYEATLRRLRALDPELLLTAHYPVMERDAGARVPRPLARLRGGGARRGPVRRARRRDGARAAHAPGGRGASARSPHSRTSWPPRFGHISPSSDAGSTAETRRMRPAFTSGRKHALMPP